MKFYTVQTNDISNVFSYSRQSENQVNPIFNYFTKKKTKTYDLHLFPHCSPRSLTHFYTTLGTCKNKIKIVDWASFETYQQGYSDYKLTVLGILTEGERWWPDVGRSLGPRGIARLVWVPRRFAMIAEIGTTARSLAFYLWAASATWGYHCIARTFIIFTSITVVEGRVICIWKFLS